MSTAHSQQRRQVLPDPTFNPPIEHIQGRWWKPRWHLDVVVHPARVAERAHVSRGDVYYGGADSDRKKEVERVVFMPACRCRSGAGERRKGVVSTACSCVKASMQDWICFNKTRAKHGTFTLTHDTRTTPTSGTTAYTGSYIPCRAVISSHRRYTSCSRACPATP